MLLSASSRFPDGLANSSGMVGKNLMFNGWSSAEGIFDQPVNGYKSIATTRVIHDFYSIDPSFGFYGGGGIDSRHPSDGLPMRSALDSGRFGGPRWGSEYKRLVREEFTHTAAFHGHSTSLPLASNTVTLDDTLKDRWGRSALCCTYKDHPDDIATAKFFQDRSVELLEAAGAKKINRTPVVEQESNVHLLGTCRMGDDPENSVVDRYNRSHDVSNLFMCDGSSLVTSGRGQPTMTIMALAFRTADYIIQASKRNEI
jgi:choline dehydrogenase-like flavoprotein